MYSITNGTWSSKTRFKLYSREILFLHDHFSTNDTEILHWRTTAAVMD